MEQKQKGQKLAQVNGTYVKSVEGTPFSLIKIENEKQDAETAVVVEHEETYKIVLGRQIVSPQNFENEEDALNYIERKPWELICQTIYILTHETK